MNWLDLGLIIFVLIFVIIGIKQGFMSSVLSHFSLGLNCLIGYFIYKPISLVFDKLFHLTKVIKSHYAAQLIASSPDFEANLLDIPGADLSNFVSETIKNSKLPGLPKILLRWFINKPSLYATLHESEHTTRTLADIVSGAFSTFFTTIISFVTALILIYLVIWIFNIIVNKLRKIGFVKFVDGILGAVYGVIRAFLILVSICFVINLMSPLSFMTPVTTYINSSLFGKAIYIQIEKFMDYYLNYTDIIYKLFLK